MHYPELIDLREIRATGRWSDNAHNKDVTIDSGMLKLKSNNVAYDHISPYTYMKQIRFERLCDREQNWFYN